MKKRSFLVFVMLVLGMLMVSCGEQQTKEENEFADAPDTAPVDIAPDISQNAETALVAPETAPDVQN